MEIHNEAILRCVTGVSASPTLLATPATSDDAPEVNHFFRRSGVGTFSRI
jgi:hypothetical protein